jgi:hypothetical protein
MQFHILDEEGETKAFRYSNLNALPLEVRVKPNLETELISASFKYVKEGSDAKQGRWDFSQPPVCVKCEL